MTTISAILNDAATGVQTAQTALQVVSNNISNVNTPGYVQTQANQASLAAGAEGAGVTITDIQRITNQYLEAAAFQANAGSGAAAAVETTMNQAQSLFGDPSASGSLFANLDGAFSAFSAYAATPTSAAAASAVSAASQFFAQSSGIFANLTTLGTDADSQIGADVATVNGLLAQVSQLNATISQGQVAGRDVTGAQNQQSQLITKLSSLINLKVVPAGAGGVSVLAKDGTTLVGPAGPSTLAYDATGPTGTLTIANAEGQSRPFDGVVSSGEIGGLLQLRNVDLPNLKDQLSSLVTGAASSLNAIHNAHTAVPPPTTLTGQTTGLPAATVAGDFTGKTTIAFVNRASGAIDHTVAIDFTAGSISVDGAAGAAFTPGSFLSTLQTAMSGLGGSATYAGGALTLASGGSDGLAVKDDPTTPARDGGRGFSDVFGLNNLVANAGVANPATGLAAGDALGFPGGQSLTLRVAGPDGAKLQDVTITPAAGGTAGALLAQLNSTAGGVGAYGAFSLSAAGALTFTPLTPGSSVSVVADQTVNSEGASVSQLFGLGVAARAVAAANLQVRGDIRAGPALLASASLNLSAAAGTAAVQPGDTSGADALGQAGLALVSFPAVAGLSAQTATLSGYAAAIAGSIANAASSASNAKTSSAAVASSANAALTSVEGVSIDQELINLTTYQQAYNASARMIQAANQLFTTLMNMTN